MTRYPDRRRLKERPPHWPTALILVAYLLAWGSACGYGIYLLLKPTVDAIAAVRK